MHTHSQPWQLPEMISFVQDHGTLRPLKIYTEVSLAQCLICQLELIFHGNFVTPIEIKARSSLYEMRARWSLSGDGTRDLLTV